jgi:enamine deaminase RidA (YjgF/YER057c/UK114 family)
MDPPEPIVIGVSHQIGQYADAIRVPAGYEQIITSGTPGLTADGELPDNIADQARQAWQNVEAALARAGASISDVVSIRQWLTDADDIKAYSLVRSEFVKHECAMMLAVIPALVWPSIKVEIEVVAVRASTAS